MKMKSFFGIIILLALVATSCRKGEGKGGKATITGKVYVGLLQSIRVKYRQKLLCAR